MQGRRFFFAILILLLFVHSSFALTIKIGSSAPDGSPWDMALDEMAVRWSQITNGRVQVRIYPGGSAGSEQDTIRKVRIGQLQGAVVTTGGLTSISTDMLIFGLPLFIRNDGELNYILEIMRDDLDGIIADKGFALISWQNAGWARPFAKKPVIYPGDLKEFKVALGIENATYIQAWQSIGYRIIQVSNNDFMSALQTGMIDAFVLPALVAASYQWFALAPNMCVVDLAPLVGGLIIDNRVWERIPEEYRPRLLDAARETISPLQESTDELTTRAISLMEENGLASFDVDDAALERWVRDLEGSYDKIIGATISPDLFNTMKTHLIEYRNSHD